MAIIVVPAKYYQLKKASEKKTFSDEIQTKFGKSTTGLTTFVLSEILHSMQYNFLVHEDVLYDQYNRLTLPIDYWIPKIDKFDHNSEYDNLRDRLNNICLRLLSGQVIKESRARFEPKIYDDILQTQSINSYNTVIKYLIDSGNTGFLVEAKGKYTEESIQNEMDNPISELYQLMRKLAVDVDPLISSYCNLFVKGLATNAFKNRELYNEYTAKTSFFRYFPYFPDLLDSDRTGFTLSEAMMYFCLLNTTSGRSVNTLNQKIKRDAHEKINKYDKRRAKKWFENIKKQLYDEKTHYLMVDIFLLLNYAGSKDHYRALRDAYLREYLLIEKYRNKKDLDRVLMKTEKIYVDKIVFADNDCQSNDSVRYFPETAYPQFLIDKNHFELYEGLGRIYELSRLIVRSIVPQTAQSDNAVETHDFTREILDSEYISSREKTRLKKFGKYEISDDEYKISCWLVDIANQYINCVRKETIELLRKLPESEALDNFDEFMFS